MTSRFERQKGTALVAALMISGLLFAIAGAYLILSRGGAENSARQLANAEARLAAEDGLHLSMAEVKTGIDSDGNGVGTINATAPDGRVITASATFLGSSLYRFHAQARLQRANAAADIVAETFPSGSLFFTARGAVTSQGPVSTLGSMVIDGRDWNITGTALAGAGTYGISSMGTITNGGASMVGGNGWAPMKPPHAGTQDPLANWSDGINQDNDAFVDEEAFDGIDNDGDGLIDEDTHGYPSSPDVKFHLPEGSLKAAAILSGTYYTSPAQFDAAVIANGNKVPGGKVIYCDFAVWDPVTFGASFNSPPSVIVQHNATGSAQMKNLHGMFCGLVLADFVIHLNGDFIIVGAMQSFANTSMGNTFGLGNGQVRFSSAVLANLPTAGGDLRVRIRGWNRSAVQ